jgi:hypothetical protein
MPFFFVNFELSFSVTASCIVLKLQFIVIYKKIEKREVWSPRGKTYLSNKKRTLPSSVVVLKIWMFKNHRFSTISNQVNPTLKGLVEQIK